LTDKKKIYFISDVHLGYDHEISSKDREQMLISWIKSIALDAHSLYIVGDLFDYWFEYKTVVPKGYFKLFAALSELINQGVEVHYLKGNHDLWHYGYLQNQIGLEIYDHPITVQLDNIKVHLAHGDGLGQGERKYKLIKWILTNSLCQRIFSCLHPSIGLPLMKSMSQLSRDNHEDIEALSANKMQIDYCNELLKRDHKIDYFIMGHRHTPLVHQLNHKDSTYINLGDWITQFTYLKWDGHQMNLRRYKKRAN